MNARVSVLVGAWLGLSIGIASCEDEFVLQETSVAGSTETGTTSQTCSELCAAGRACVDGSCSCLRGTECGASCVDTDADPENCGDCGVTCRNSERCVSGTCECRAGLADCGAGCTNSLSDPDNCGDCGVTCEGDTVCSEGACESECADGLTSCDGGCVDTLTDADHCGVCGTECTGGQSCELGVCSCPIDQESCDGGCVPAGTCDPPVTTGSGGMTSTSASTSASTSTSQGEGGEGGAPSAATVSSTGSGECSISIEDDLSDAISTVGIVTFSATNIEVTKAEIEFTRVGGGPAYVAPVDLDEPEYRTLLLGMKAASDYEYRVILNDGECTSPVRTITTGPLPDPVPSFTKDTPLPDAVAPGFMISSGGIAASGSSIPAFIIDSDGDVVWWTEPPNQCTRAKMDWEGKHMYMMALNLRHNLTSGEVRRVSMDGLEVERKLSGLNGGHHDFTVTPGGNVVAIVHQPSCSGVLERTPAGVISTIVADINTIYEPTNDCHPNSIHYHPEDDSFTISDRNPNLFVKISRSGELQWQFGGTNPKASVHYQATWKVNHGHQVLPGGRFLFFNNSTETGESRVMEFELTTPNATEVWSYADSYASPTLGDVQRLPNGNTLITYSNRGIIQEVDSDKNLVRELATATLGYVEHRPTLYGPPPR